MLGVTFTAEERLAEFMARFRPPYPVGPVTRGTALNWAGIQVDDGKALPRLVLLDRQHALQESHGWADPIFADPAKENQRIRAAIERLMTPPKRNPQR